MPLLAPTTEEGTMQQRWFRPLAVIGFAAALSHASTTEAQVTEARKVNMENARKLYVIIVDAVGAGKRDEAVKALDEFKANVDAVLGKLYRPVRENLHEKERSVLQPKMEIVQDRSQRLQTSAGVLKSASSSVSEDPSRLLSGFKDDWQAFDDSFKQLSNDFIAYGKELQDRMKRFQEVCGGDCS
jgi:hypothetical protein